MSMTLGEYTFAWEPDRWTIPKKEKYSGRTLTYRSAAFFSFGVEIVGKEIPLEWNWMFKAQFDSLYALYISDAQLVWVPGDGYAYTVEIVDFVGEYFEVSGHVGPWRQNVKMLLMIMDRTVES